MKQAMQRSKENKTTGWPGWTGGAVVAERRLYRGAPTIFVNGAPIHGESVLFRTRSGYSWPSLSRIDPEIVVPYVFFRVGPDAQPDFTEIEGHFTELFDKHPRALGGYIVNLLPSRDWVRAHPDEMPLFDRPFDWLNEPGDREDPWNKASAAEADASWASSVWRRDSARFVEALARHIHKVFQGRVIYYQVGAGKCGENAVNFDPYYSGRWFCGDFSAPMISYFLAKLKTWYRNDLTRMRKAWGDRNVTFDNAMPPDRNERLQTQWFALRSPLCSRTADYHRAVSEAVEDCAMLWAKAVKRGTNNESLAASPLGSILDAGINAFMVHHNNNGAFRRALKCPQLDMLESPASYILRDPGKGDTSSMIPLGAVRMAGKIWLRDFDTRTSYKVAKGKPPSLTGDIWLTTDTPWLDTQVLLRDAGYSLLKGGAFWWHEIQDKMFSLPQHIRTVRRLQEIGRAVVHADRSIVPGLAVFVDDRSNYRQANSNRLIFAMNYEARRLHWTHAGMASETYHLDNAASAGMAAHNVIMVTNAFCMTDKQARAVVGLARRHHSTVIWLVAPGIQTPTGFDIEHVSSITGFKIRAVDVEALPRITLLPGPHPWSRPAGPEGIIRSFGTGAMDYDDSGARGVGPLFYVDAAQTPEVTVLGELDALAKPGLAVREMDGYTSVYCSAPFIHNALLRAIGTTAGAHVYLDTDDLVHVAQNLLLVHAKREGVKRIRWPGKAERVVDLYTGRLLARDTREWTLRMKRHATRFLYVGPSGRLPWKEEM
ncbi:MAG: hypothetical protein HQ592_06160 [Planctomycetes bacterium]|nr:hypothetical protein [Planctomycetota bacterium]